MQVPPPPPPFVPPSGPVPQKKSNTALIVSIILAVVLIPCIALVGLGFWGFNVAKKTVMPLTSCLIGFDDVQKAMVDYAKDHDGKLPDAATWQDDIRAQYQQEMERDMKDQSFFKPMDPNGDWGCPAIGNSAPTGMAYNEDVAGKKIDDIKDPESTVLVFETDKPQHNAHEKYKERGETAPPLFGQPREWLVAYVKQAHGPHHVRIGNGNGTFSATSSTTGDGSDSGSSSGSSGF